MNALNSPIRPMIANSMGEIIKSVFIVCSNVLFSFDCIMNLQEVYLLLFPYFADIWLMTIVYLLFEEEENILD
jgi:hypothetical protein